MKSTDLQIRIKVFICFSFFVTTDGIVQIIGTSIQIFLSVIVNIEICCIFIAYRNKICLNYAHKVAY